MLPEYEFSKNHSATVNNIGWKQPWCTIDENVSRVFCEDFTDDFVK